MKREEVRRFQDGFFAGRQDRDLEIGKIDIIACDDWIVLYKDGVKVAENHSLPVHEVLEALGISFNQVYLDNDPYVIDLSDHFPERLPDAEG